MFRLGCFIKILTTLSSTSDGKDYFEPRILLFLRGQRVQTAQLAVNLGFGVRICIEELVVALVLYHHDTGKKKDTHVYIAFLVHPLESSAEVFNEVPNKSELTVRRHRKHERCDQSSGTTVAVYDRFSNSGSRRHSRSV